MSYPKETVKLRPTRGLSIDTPASDVPPDFWTVGRNVLFRDAFAERMLGSRDAYVAALQAAAPIELLHGLYARVSGIDYWLMFEQDGSAWAFQGETATQIDAALLGAVDGPWNFSSGVLNGVPVVSNAKDEPVYWAGPNLARLPGWEATATCGFLAPFKFHLFAMNIEGPSGTLPNRVRWSAAAEPGTVPPTWTPGPGNNAGFVDLADSPGEVSCAYPLGDSLVFYKRGAMYQANFVRGNQVFAFRRLSAVVGAMSSRSVCDIGGRHFVVSDGDILITDGTSFVSVGDGRVRDLLFDQLDDTNFRNLFTVYNAPRNEVLIAYPSKGQTYPDAALVYDVGADAFGFRELDSVRHGLVGVTRDVAGQNTWAAQTETWEQSTSSWGSTFVSVSRANLMLMRGQTMRLQDTEAGEDIPAIVGKHSMALGDSARVKFLKRLHVRANATSGPLYVRTGSQMNPSEPIRWSSEVLLPQGQQIVNTFAQGRYLSFEIRSEDSNVWKITGVDMEVELRGYH